MQNSPSLQRGRGRQNTVTCSPKTSLVMFDYFAACLHRCQKPFIVFYFFLLSTKNARHNCAIRADAMRKKIAPGAQVLEVKPKAEPQWSSLSRCLSRLLCTSVHFTFPLKKDIFRGDTDEAPDASPVPFRKLVASARFSFNSSVSLCLEGRPGNDVRGLHSGRSCRHYATCSHYSWRTRSQSRADLKERRLLLFRASLHKF